eukprot:768564-Hanusia_phi.AAC.8
MQALRRSLQHTIARRFSFSNVRMIAISPAQAALMRNIPQDPVLPSVPEIKASAEQIKASENMTGREGGRGVVG